MKNKVAGGIALIIGAVILILVSTVLRPCQGLMEMPCHRSTVVARVILAVIVVINLLKIVIKDQKTIQNVFSMLSVILGISLWFIPLIGSCMPIPGMTCITRTWPTLKIGGSLIAVTEFVFLIWNILESRRKTVVHNR